MRNEKLDILLEQADDRYHSDFCRLLLECYGTPRKVVVLADSSCNYCKGYIFVLVHGYVVGDFLYLCRKQSYYGRGK